MRRALLPLLLLVAAPPPALAGPEERAAEEEAAQHAVRALAAGPQGLVFARFTEAVLLFTVAAAGTVSSTEVTGFGTTFGHCLVARAARWKFDKAKGKAKDKHSGSVRLKLRVAREK